MGGDAILNTLGREHQLQLAWLAGLLEAEGTFLRPVPSMPGAPAIACYMTDQDTVDRVAALFGTGRFRHRRSNRRRPMLVTRLRGSGAVLLMQDLLPLMGRRRRAAICAALDAFDPPARKLSLAAAEEIRRLCENTEITISELSRRFGVARSTIRQVRSGRIYNSAGGPRWRHDLVLPLVACPLDDLSTRDLYWLAGWLEGEGSFVRPPPSDPRRARILGCTRDEDVASRVGLLLNVSPRLSHPPRAKSKGWSPMWRILRRGSEAVRLMKALHPLMGSRRQDQITAALAGVGERAA